MYAFNPLAGMPPLHPPAACASVPAAASAPDACAAASARGRAHTSIVCGPYTAYAAAAWSRPCRPTGVPPGQTPKMVPTAKLAPIMLLPSSGSNTTV